jgi:hypothetical protein
LRRWVTRRDRGGALDPGAACAPPTPQRWAFLLGRERCEELARLIGRLSAYFNPYCAPAVAGTLRLWQSIASDQEWRKDAHDHLYRQLRRWYELLVLSGSADASLKAIFGVVGVVGLSAAGIQAGLKSSARGLLSRLRQDAYTDLVASAVVEAPGKPGARSPRKAIVAEVRKRTLTTVADAAVP